MAKRKKAPNYRERLWGRLDSAIEEYVQAAIAESWKGGGDPISIPAIEAGLVLRRAELNEVIELLHREYEE